MRVHVEICPFDFTSSSQWFQGLLCPWLHTSFVPLVSAMRPIVRQTCRGSETDLNFGIDCCRWDPLLAAREARASESSWSLGLAKVVDFSFPSSPQVGSHLSSCTSEHGFVDVYDGSRAIHTYSTSNSHASVSMGSWYTPRWRSRAFCAMWPSAHNSWIRVSHEVPRFCYAAADNST